MDGVLPVINLIDMGLEDKERIEALKGASAIYYGFSPPSGIINMVMKRPTQDPLLAVKVFGNTFGEALTASNWRSWIRRFITVIRRCRPLSAAASSRSSKAVSIG